MAAKGYKQWDYSKKLLNQHQKAHKEKMEIQATAQVDDAKQFDSFKEMIQDKNATHTMKAKVVPKPLPEPKESTAKEKAKMEWQKEVRSLRNNIHKDYCTLFNLKVKATTMVSDKESGVTKELLNSINKGAMGMMATMKCRLDSWLWVLALVPLSSTPRPTLPSLPRQANSTRPTRI